MTTQDTTAAKAYKEQLYDPRWRLLREKVLQRDGHRCRSCGSGGGLQVHHRQYHVQATSGAWKKPWEYEQRLLVSLCERCHQAGHRQYQVPVITV
jgi:5-methylcytosine-specific restriction endonuclease McrA